MKKFICMALIGVLGVTASLNAQDSNERRYNIPNLTPQRNSGNLPGKPKVEGFAQEKVVEKFNRGLIAFQNQQGEMYISWRLLSDDPENVAFNVYCSVNGGRFSKLNPKPITKTTDFIDKKAHKGDVVYMVRAVVKGKEQGDSEIVAPNADGLNYTSIKLKGEYSPSKIALADLNGDGIYDYIIKYPGQVTDPGSWRKSVDTYKIEAYLSDGTYLWTKDLGWNIEQGVWYSPFIAFDFNGDGKAEVAVKTAPTNHDYRDATGRVVGKVPYNTRTQEVYTLPAVEEFCSVLDGMTGEVIDSVPWPEQARSFGDYNRNNRNQIGVAYLDGRTPALLVNRGTYRRMVVDAYQLNGNKLEKLWRWDGDEENPIIRSAGAHSITTYDVDGDGRDEVIMGTVVIDDNGEALWSRGLGHPDRATVGKIDPSRPGLQIHYACEVAQDSAGVCLVDAATGEYIWIIGQNTTHVGSGFAADIDPSRPGLECFGAEDGKAGHRDRYMHTASGEKIGTQEDVPGDKNWIWWDSDLLRETTAQVPADTTEMRAMAEARAAAQAEGRPFTPPANAFRRRGFNVAKYKGEALPGGPIQGSMLMVADIRGDWREEIITTLPGELRIYSTPIPAVDRRVCLMQDNLYRSYVAHRSMGYDQPAMTSYYLGVPPEDAAKYAPLIK